MAKKVVTGKVDSKVDEVVSQVSQQVVADTVKLTTKDTELTVDCGEESILVLAAFNTAGTFINFPSYRVIKGSAVGRLTIGSTEQAKVFRTDKSGILKLDVRTTGRTEIVTLSVEKARSAIM